MLGKYWIDKQENGNQNSFFKMLDGMQLNADEKAIFDFMVEAQSRYENIKLPPEPRLNVSSLDGHFPKASEIVLEALTKCCVLTYVFVPIDNILNGKYKEKLSFSQRYALWKGTGFKGVNAYAPDFIKESIYQETPITSDLFDLHQQMNIKDFSLKQVYQETIEDVVKNPQKVSLWNSIAHNAVAFRQAVFKAYPDLSGSVKTVCRSRTKIDLSFCQQKTL